MSDQFERTRMLLGTDAVDVLRRSRVAVFGVGGVGGYVCEALARSGIGALDIVDNDTVSLSNLNRQIIALHSTVGRYKTDVVKERMLDIAPDMDIRTYKCFFLPQNSSDFDFGSYDYVVDAVDTVTAKLELVKRCREAGVPVISSMGTGNKLDPAAFKIADIYETRICPLAKVMRKELKKSGIDSLKVVYSEEEPLNPAVMPGVQGKENGRRAIPGSTAFVPPAAGLIIASEVIKDIIIKYEETKKLNVKGFPVKCACCGVGIITEPRQICTVCGWQHDRIQNEDPAFKGGANKNSLNEYRKIYEKEASN